METSNFSITQEIKELNEKNNPAADLLEEEFDELIYNIGTLMFLVSKKSISPSSFFLQVASDNNLASIMMEISGIDNKMLLYNHILARYPNLTKSKMLRRKMIEYANVNR